MNRGWKRPFDGPIPLPRGRELVTLKDAADNIMRLPKVEQNLAEWQTATEALIMAAEGRGPLMHARIGVMRALNRHPPQDQLHLAKAETPARRRLASKLTSCPRTLLVKSSWAFAPSTLLLLQDKRFGPPSVAR
jgi:hypothetical protein